MKKLIFYFHGYGSSANSEKVSRLLREEQFNVYSFNIDIDPEIAYNQLNQDISNALIKNESTQVVFVGTSLGGWWASKMAALFQCKAVIINPSINPENSLFKYGVSDFICKKYHPIIPSINYKYFFAKYDEVIDSEHFRESLISSGYNVTVDAKADHRFGGEAFEQVIVYIKDQIF